MKYISTFLSKNFSSGDKIRKEFVKEQYKWGCLKHSSHHQRYSRNLKENKKKVVINAYLIPSPSGFLLKTACVAVLIKMWNIRRSQECIVWRINTWKTKAPELWWYNFSQLLRQYSLLKCTAELCEDINVQRMFRCLLQ